MHSSLIGKVQKAHLYAQQPERVIIERLALTFHGENGDHHVSYVNGVWNCDCHFFDGWHICCHTMAVEQMLGAMVPVKQQLDVPVPA